jgi:hypothetical protein
MCSRFSMIALCLLASVAQANSNSPPPPVSPPPPPASVPTASGPSAESSSTSLSNATSTASASSAATSTATQTQQATGTANAAQTQYASGGSGGTSSASANNAGNGNGSVDVGGDTSDYKALAVSLPGLVAAPAVVAQCMLHSRGWGGFSAGATGGTFFDKECMAVTNCFAMADRYALWQRVDLAMRQLETCGGVVIPPPVQPVAPAVDLSGYVRFEDLKERDRRMMEKAVQK